MERDGLKRFSGVSKRSSISALFFTTERDIHILSNNFEYSKTLALFALANDVRFIFASTAATYGDGGMGFSDVDADTIS